MLSASGLSSPMRRESGVDFDEEKEFGVYPGAEWQRPAEVRSNLDRFRLMVGITTAPSMQADDKRSSIAGLLVKSVISRSQSPRNSILRPEAAHVAQPGAPVDPEGQRPNIGSVISAGSMPRKDRVEVDTITAPIRMAHNLGIYEVVVSKGTKARQTYKWASLTINLCLGLQIVVAAALTALGASEHSGGSVTTLGAINTVIAGFLTYLKGSGLPGKLKYFQHEWDKIRDYIEARERDLRVNDNAFDVNEQVDYIRYIFDAVKKDIDSNRADRFTSSGALHTMPESNDLQRMQKKKLVELGKSVVSEITHAYKEHSDAARNAAKEQGDAARSTYREHDEAARNAFRESRDAAGNAFRDSRDAAGNAFRESRDAAQNVYRQYSDASRNLEKQAERQVNVRDAVKALTAEAEEIKKKMHDSADLEHFLTRILHHKATEKKPDEHPEK